MFYNFRTCYRTISNMRRYGHKCHFRIIIFYSTFSLSSQYLIQRFLSLLTVFSLSSRCSLSLSSSDHPPSTSNQQQSSHQSLIKPSHRSTYAIVQRYGGLTDQSHAIILRLCLAFSSPSRHANLAITDLAMPISGLCWWMWMWMWMWVGGCGFVQVVGLGCGFVPISLVFFFFFFFFFWGGVGRCGFVPVVAVGVVATVVASGHCCGNGGCAVVVDDDDEVDRE